MALAKGPSAKDIAAELTHADPYQIEALCEKYANDERKQVQKACQSALRRLEKFKAEHLRVQKMYELEEELSEGKIALGVDEVGRGSIAGPLTVCAVALDRTHQIEGINDSKQLSPQKREELCEQIKREALAVGICHISPEEIDANGMAASIKKAMRGAIENAGIEADCVLIDGNPVHAHPKEITIVKGDSKIASIAAASIVAKVTRDAMMVEYAQQYPQYHLDECKGYASKVHTDAISEYGVCPIHRKSFCTNFIPDSRLF